MTMQAQSSADFTHLASDSSGLVVGQSADTTTNDAISVGTNKVEIDLQGLEGTSHKRFVGFFEKSATNGLIVMKAANITLATFTPASGVSHPYKIECELWWDMNTSRVKAITTLTDYDVPDVAVVAVQIFEADAGQTTTFTTNNFTFDLTTTVSMDNTAAIKGGVAHSI